MALVYKNWLRLGAAAGLALLLGWGPVRTAEAVEFDDDGRIEAGEVIDDDVFLSGSPNAVVDGTVNGALFVSGELVEINGVVHGDVFANGGDVVIKGAVSGNVFAAGYRVRVQGPVSGTLFFAGYALEVGETARVQRNLLFAGYALDMRPGAQVAQDVVATGYQGRLAGEVGRDVTFGGEALKLDGRVGRNVNADVGAPDGDRSLVTFPFAPYGQQVSALTPGIRVSPAAQIGGRLIYKSSVDQAGAIQAAPEGGVEFKPKPTNDKPAASLGTQFFTFVVGRLRDLATLLVLGGVAAWRMPRLLNRLTLQARARPVPAAGWGLITAAAGYAGVGLLAAVVIVAGLLLSMVTLGGLARTVFGVGFTSVGLALAVFSLLVVYGSKLVVALMVGKEVMARLAPQYADQPAWPLVAGVGLYVVIRGIPVVGWVVAVAATLIGLGAMWFVWQEWRAARTAPAPVPAISE